MKATLAGYAAKARELGYQHDLDKDANGWRARDPKACDAMAVWLKANMADLVSSVTDRMVRS